LILFWNVPFEEAKNIGSYEVGFSKAGLKPEVIALTSDECFKVFKDLEKHTTYEATVVIILKDKRTISLPKIQVTTLTQSVSNDKVQAFTSEADVAITWDPPKGTNDVFQYHVRFSPESESPLAVVEQMVPPVDFPFAIYEGPSAKITSVKASVSAKQRNGQIVPIGDINIKFVRTTSSVGSEQPKGSGDRLVWILLGILILMAILGAIVAYMYVKQQQSRQQPQLHLLEGRSGMELSSLQVM